IGGVLSLAGAFVRLAAAMAGVNAAASGGVVGRLLAGAGIAGAAATGVAAGWALDEWWPNNPLARAGRAIGNWLYDSSGAARKDDALRFFRDRGWSAAQAAGII